MYINTKTTEPYKEYVREQKNVKKIIKEAKQKSWTEKITDIFKGNQKYFMV